MKKNLQVSFKIGNRQEVWIQQWIRDSTNRRGELLSTRDG